jgi:hypothetical protein
MAAVIIYKAFTIYSNLWCKQRKKEGPTSDVQGPTGRKVRRSTFDVRREERSDVRGPTSDGRKSSKSTEGRKRGRVKQSPALFGEAGDAS